MAHIRRSLSAALVSISLLASTQVNAGLWEERQALYAISKELMAIESLVRVAERQSTPSSRTAFKYNVMLEDLRLIRSGIDHHLMQPMEPVDPSAIKQLDPAYTGHDR
jgi:RAQPRD family integrative conjugative element protein